MAPAPSTTATSVADHPARWTGPELATSSGWVHRFADDEVAELREFGALMASAGIAPLEMIGSVPDLPLLAPVLAEWRRELHTGRGVVLARGLPVSEMSYDEIAAAYLALGLHLGTPVAQNAAGDLLGHVRDDGSDPNDPTVRRYRTRLPQPFHVDGADVVGLLCLHQGRSGGLSQIVSSVTVYDELARRRPDLAPLLREPWFFDTYGQSVPGTARAWFQRPMVTGTQEDFAFLHLRWYIDKAQEHPDVPRLSAAQVALLDLVDALAHDPALHLDMTFEPGDIQLLSNRTILHARTGYEDFDEPERKRHLLRLWLNRGP